jgi:hypothetical protein
VRPLKIKKVENPNVSSESQVQLKTMGNIFEVRHKTNLSIITTRKIDSENYLDLKTGEVMTYKHHETRADDKTSISQSLKHLRDLINTNVTEPKNALWITLTYAENMQDTAKLYEDFRKFNQRLRYFHSSNQLPDYEYIVCCEPQGRGAWHMHLLLIYQTKAPFIENSTLSQIWDNGFTKTTSLKDVDNIGVYLSAYLGDMEVNESLKSGAAPKKLLLKEVEKGKYIVKGGRLKMYPAGLRMYRTSKGIKRPEVADCTFAEALETVGNAPLVYEKTIQLVSDSGSLINTINYKYYNKIKRGEHNGETNLQEP